MANLEFVAVKVIHLLDWLFQIGEAFLAVNLGIDFGTDNCSIERIRHCRIGDQLIAN